MVWHGSGCVNDAQDAGFQLQFLAQFTLDRGCGFFIAIKPSTGQSPGNTRMIGVFDQEHMPVAVEDDGGNAERVARLHPAVYEVGQARYEGETAQQFSKSSRHTILFAL